MNRADPRPPRVRRSVTANERAWFGRTVLSLLLVFLVLALGILVGFLAMVTELSAVRGRGTNVGDVLGDCMSGQVVRWNGSAFLCDGDVWSLGDIDDVEVRQPKPEDEQCLCFDGEWVPQGPFAKPEDLPDFLNGTILPCENLPDDLCDALRWGTVVGTWDADANDPTLASGGCPFGDFYVVAAAGTTDLDGNAVWDLGDALACSATGWNRIGKDFPVLSVNGMTGDVLLGLGDLTDVDLAGQANGDFLQRVAGVWTPQQLLLFLGDLTDADTTNATAGDALVFTTPLWQPDPDCCSAEGDIAQRQGARVRLSGSQGFFSTPGGYTKVQFDLELDDPGGNFNPVTFEYTAPTTGYYGAWTSVLFPINGVVNIANLAIRGRLILNGVGIVTEIHRHLGSSTSLPPRGATGPVTIAIGYIRLNAGDTLHVEVGQENTGGSQMFVSSGFSNFAIVFYGPV